MSARAFRLYLAVLATLALGAFSYQTYMVHSQLPSYHLVLVPQLERAFIPEAPPRSK